MKSQIIEQLGRTEILLPRLIADGLTANDRVKARLSVLQEVARRAADPHGERFDLAEECRAVGIDAAAMAALMNGARALPSDQIAAPGLATLGTAIRDDVGTMVEAVAAGDAVQGEVAASRLEAIAAATSLGASDSIDRPQLARLTGVSESGSDSLHRLVMDLHKSLNHLSATHAEEVLAGAHVCGLLPEDRPAVEAFMCGLESTRRLKFDHPGLATSATRAGERLSIQNDIGETDAHVVVVAVEGDTVTLTYTDVHRARARFFTNLFRGFAVAWSGLDRRNAEGLGDDGGFYLVTGRFAAADTPQRNSFLEAIGAALVFLIDWNKARKVMRAWIPKADAVHVLDWAARNRFGHRAFLELGGSELVASAVRHATPTRIGFGERLDRSLGRDAAVDFLKTVLRVSAEALLEGGSTRLARDRIEADLVRHLRRVNDALLAIVVRQAGLAREIAVAIAHAVAEQQARRPVDRKALADRARRIEEKADRIALDARREIERVEADPAIADLVNRVEEAIDELEQAAFIGSLVPDGVAPEVLAPIAALCAAAISSTEAAASGAAAAADVSDGQRADSEDALAAIGRLIEAEHAGDAAERTLTTVVLGGACDLRTALSSLELARALERATDRLAGFGHLLHQRLIADLAS